MRPHIAKIYFETYVIYDHKAHTQKITEILILKILRLQDFFVHWPTKIAITRSIFEIQGSSFDFFLPVCV